ncbi:hypothetical protein VC83_05032 [Pseudogymnoascus destructans]|uniref:Uncharacterized protein n=2 Tax=Pseudogymnoascus destructans TaxID=655981 RepID=L8G0G9_PSED2|nr:uncharacterized protein VC83_05032 [Pseudogymnoascus destructans]ELR06274.1 hypothetical protein GMDG_02068 [Pseudogymnoascus destructans 20631-21]OAF58682.1 hypothetical protein VC83_05032 [Pseudogymnoascus destructans]
MAGKKRTAAPLPPNSGFKASASFLMARVIGPSQATRAKPVAMNEEAHTEFVPVYIHTAKCDICEKRNDSVLQRCVTCTSQFCYRCMLGGDGIHVKSYNMDWTDYGAQANSTFKAQKKAQEHLANHVANHKPGSALQQRYTSASEIPSCRTNHRELKDAHKGTMEAFVADEIPAKAGPAHKGQKTTATYQQPNQGRPAPAAKKNTRAENVTRNRTEAQFPLIIPGHKDDGPKFQRFISNLQETNGNDETEGEWTSSDNEDHDPRRISDFFSGPIGVIGRKRNSLRPAQNPWTKEIKENKKDIRAELSLIDRHLDLLNDKKKLALVRKMHIDDALDAACILMSMRTDARGFPDEKETSAPPSESLAKKLKSGEALNNAHIFTGMRTSARGIPVDTEYASKGTQANTRLPFRDGLGRVFEGDEAVGASTSTGMQTDAGFYLAERTTQLTETQRSALEKERKIDAVVEAAYYSFMREGRSSR